MVGNTALAYTGPNHGNHVREWHNGVEIESRDRGDERTDCILKNTFSKFYIFFSRTLNLDMRFVQKTPVQTSKFLFSLLQNSNCAVLRLSFEFWQRSSGFFPRQKFPTNIFDFPLQMTGLSRGGRSLLDFFLCIRFLVLHSVNGWVFCCSMFTRKRKKFDKIEKVDQKSWRLELSTLKILVKKDRCATDVIWKRKIIFVRKGNKSGEWSARRLCT